MKYFLVVLVLFSTYISADEWHDTIYASCDLVNGIFKVEYQGEYNLEGEGLVKKLRSAS